jgi:hypothetical protein
MLPSSQDELSRMVPGSNREGSFPRADLAAGEKVIFEVRPGFIGLHPTLFYASMPFVLFFGLVVAVGLASYGTAYVGPGAFVMILVLLPIFYSAYSWSRTAYALTDRRALVRSGSDFQSASLEEIQQIELAGSRIVLRTSAPSPAPGETAPRLGKVVWYGVPEASAVVPFLSSAVEYYRLKDRASELRERLTIAEMQQRITCPYCGGWIDASRIDPKDPRCPNCTAPLVAAPDSG